MAKLLKKEMPDTSHREELLYRLERYAEMPLLILSFVMIPLLVGPLVWELSPQEESTFITLDYFIWAIFAIDLVVKVLVSPQRLNYLCHHWLEVLVVAVPFFRPLRILRIFIFGSRAWVGTRRLINVDFIIIYGIGLVIIAATIVASVEGGVGASIHSFADALWWAVVTITTVGYGDMVPATTVGRAVAFFLMFGGIAFFSGVTANLASFLVKSHDTEKKAVSQLVKEVEGLRQEIAKLRTDSGD